MPNLSTEEKGGNLEYWECNECDKIFSDEEGKEEIPDKSSVILPVLTPDNNGGKPKNVISGGAIAGIVIGILVFLLLVAYVVGYFALYRRGIIKGEFFDAIYAPMNAIFGEKEKDKDKE